MSLITVKEAECTDTPVIAFDIVLVSGEILRVSHYPLRIGEATYDARVLSHNLSDSRFPYDEGSGGAQKLSLTLSNLDGFGIQVERSTGWKGAKVTARFLFYNLQSETPTTESVVIFRGICDSPEAITDQTVALSFYSRLGIRRIVLPETRIQSYCPWEFPSKETERREAVDGGARGKYSLLYRCGYSPDIDGGAGNLKDGIPYTECDRSKSACVARGMFSRDAMDRVTARFGGLQYVPETILVRTHGDKSYHVSEPQENLSRYNDPVPLVYGTVRYRPPIVFARNDGNLTRMQVLLGAGEIEGVRRVQVNDVMIPRGVAGQDMTSTGWYELVSSGRRNGEFDANFTRPDGTPLGDPYGSMAYLSVVTPNRISDGKPLPKVEVLIDGLKLPRYAADGTSLGEQFTSNPGWVVLDLLRRSGWTTEEIDLASFAQTASYCDELVEWTLPEGNRVILPRFEVSLAVRSRRSAYELIRGILNAAGLLFCYDAQGRLQLRPETTLEEQHPVKKSTSNAVLPLNGGWPAYEFGDGTNGFGGILRDGQGKSTLRIWTRPTSESPNRLTVEIQDALNEFQQDTVSVADPGDIARTGQEISTTYPAMGIPHSLQARRILRLAVQKSTRGNLYVRFESSARGVGLQPGDIITLSHASAGFDRQPFRVLQLSPTANYERVSITAQIHDDAWYLEGEAGWPLTAHLGRRTGAWGSYPRPITGRVVKETGEADYLIEESLHEGSDGAPVLQLRVGFTKPNRDVDITLSPPRVELTPKVTAGGGSLTGGQTLYYALTAARENGQESNLSFVIEAVLPEGQAGYSVTLGGIVSVEDAERIRVYRGPSPKKLLLIGEIPAGTGAFVDSGLPAQLRLPSDPAYDHANFYWRGELYPETEVQTSGANFVANSHLELPPNEFKSKLVYIAGGRGKGQERTIISHTETTIEVDRPWKILPDATSRFVIVESGWRLCGSSYSDEVQFPLPSNAPATIQILGRAAGENGAECPPDECTITRWTLESAGSGWDVLPPPKPLFALEPDGAGQLILSGVGFESTDNLRSIVSGTLVLYYWDEHDSPTPYTLAAHLTSEGVVVTLPETMAVETGDIIQVDGELLRIAEPGTGPGEYLVERGILRSTATAHDAGTPVYKLSAAALTLSFPKLFFTTATAAKYQHTFTFPSKRVSAAELTLTNSRGTSEAGVENFTNTLDHGIRTMAGGQYSLSIDGYLRAETGATSLVSVEKRLVVRDIFATVREAASNGPIQILLRRNGAPYAELTIPAGSYISAAKSGFGLPPLEEHDLLSVDILSAGGTDGYPGKDLTVTLRL